MNRKSNVLTVDNLKTYFYLKKNKVAKAVDGVSFSIKQGETVALVGESGSGKSMTALSVMQLINKPGKIISGEINLENTDLVKMKHKQIEKIRGNEIGMIFQEPMTALNPVFTIGNQIREILMKHKKIGKKEAQQSAIKLLEEVGIPRADEIAKSYPHQLSGGMRQRVMIAMAISCEPKLLIADEPTTALDVTIQKQILDLLLKLQEKMNMAILLITHDLGVVSQYADRVLVMYGGQVIEQSSTKNVLFNTLHPYTQGLIKSIPSANDLHTKLEAIEGTTPPAFAFPEGCRFAPRCPLVTEECLRAVPDTIEASENHFVRCVLYEEGAERNVK